MEDIRRLASLGAQTRGRRRLAVACADEPQVVAAVARAAQAGWIEAELFGDAEATHAFVATHGEAAEHLRVRAAPSRQEASALAVRAVASGDCDLLMKGNVQTSLLMKDVLDRETGLRSAGKLSHVLVFDPPHLGRLFLMSDGALNIAPDLALKLEIVKNAIGAAQLLGVSEPKVALLSAIELVDPNQQASVDHAILAKMADRGQISGAKVDGPLALDNAIDPEAARIKNIRSEVAGRADVLIVHNVDVGNVFYKSLVYFSRAEVAGTVVGGKAPIILTSRADSASSKFNSVALGCALAAGAAR